MRRPIRPPETTSWRMSDGYELRGRLWPPASASPSPDYGVLYLHGIQSHGAWFEGSASLLAASGGPVLLPDRRGSGLNSAARGDTPSADRWLEDIDELAAWMEARHAVRRLGVVGVSWGGKLAALWVLRHPTRVSHLLLIAPGIFPALDIGWLARLRVAASLLTGASRMFPIPLNDPALFTNNPVGRQFIADDPQKLTHATARFLYESSRLDRRLRRLSPGDLRPETTLVLAGRDRIIRNAQTIAWLRCRAGREPAIHTLPDAAHTMEFEPRPTEFDQVLEAWAGGLAGAAATCGLPGV